MKPITILNEFHLICWATLLLGFQKGWASKSDISNYAIKLLSKDLDCGNEDVAILATADSLEGSEIKKLILKVIKEPRPEKKILLDRWRLAKLSVLNKLNLSEEEKLDKLQELYAEFDYPADMISCSVYSKDSIDPLKAMVDLISTLKNNLSNI